MALPDEGRSQIGSPVSSTIAGPSFAPPSAGVKKIEPGAVPPDRRLTPITGGVRSGRVRNVRRPRLGADDGDGDTPGDDDPDGDGLPLAAAIRTGPLAVGLPDGAAGPTEAV